MKKRIKKGLTIKQAKIITSIIAVILFILFTTPIITVAVINNLGIYELVLALLFDCLAIVIFSALCWEVLEFTAKDSKEKMVAIGYLNREEFTEILFVPKENLGSETEMISAILRKVDCKFFAKLTDNDEIILLLKDKENNEIYHCEISNYTYFNLRFKEK